MKLFDSKFKNMLLIFTIVISLFLTNPLQTLALEFPSSIGNIYELRDETSLSGYTGNKRPVPLSTGGYGFYLGTETQFLPYKIGDSTVDSSDKVTNYEYAVYCTMFGKPSPAKNSYSAVVLGNTAPTSCTKDNSWDTATSAGVAAIIKKAGNSKFVGSSLQTYYDTEIAINRFLYEVLNNECNIDSSKCNASITTSPNKISNYSAALVNLAKEESTIVKMKEDNKLEVTYPSNKILTYDDNDEIWKSQRINVKNLKYLDNYDSLNANNLMKVTLKDASGKSYDDYAYIAYVDVVDEANSTYSYQIGICNNDNSDNPYCKNISNFEPLKPSTYTAEITIGGKKTYSVAQNYSCGSEHQGITPAFVNTVSKTEQSTATFSFTIKAPEVVTGKIKVSKIDSDTNKDISGAKIKIESKDGSFSETFNMGSKTYITVDNLELGEYIITEVEAPDGYELTKQEYSVILTSDDTYAVVEMSNEMLNNSKVVIKKVDSSDNKVIKGAKLQLTNENGKIIATWVTDGTGYTITNLEIGKYYIEELEAPNGYSLNKNKVSFEIKSKNEQKTIEFSNDKIVEVPDTLSNKSKFLVMLAVAGILVGGILIYKNKFSEDGIR